MHVQPSDALPKIMLARYYGDDLPRFLSPDPGEAWDEYEPQTWNLYTYAGNNPLRFIDPDGEEMRDITRFYDNRVTNAYLAATYGHTEGFFQVVDDSLARNPNTGEMIVTTEYEIDIASDLTADYVKVKAHEYGHQQDWFDARAELGYGDLDKQLESAYNNVVAKGQRKGWSPDKIKRKAAEKADRDYKKAYKRTGTCQRV